MKYKIIVLAAVAALASAALLSLKNEGKYAEIRSDGKLIKTVSLKNSEEEFTVKAGAGFNTIRVFGGKIGVSDADCPDKVCVHTGFISSGKIPIVCLPHRLEIRVKNSRSSEPAGVSR